MRGRLLLVDDEDAVLFAMDAYFRAVGYEADTAGSVEQARELLESASYDAVVVDLRLSVTQDVNGLDVARDAVGRQPRPRVVVLTAFGSADIQEQARRLGVDAFLQKPMPLPQIAEVLGRLLA